MTGAAGERAEIAFLVLTTLIVGADTAGGATCSN